MAVKEGWTILVDRPDWAIHWVVGSSGKTLCGLLPPDGNFDTVYGFFNLRSWEKERCCGNCKRLLNYY